MLGACTETSSYLNEGFNFLNFSLVEGAPLFFKVNAFEWHARYILFRLLCSHLTESHIPLHKSKTGKKRKDGNARSGHFEISFSPSFRGLIFLPRARPQYPGKSTRIWIVDCVVVFLRRYLVWILFSRDILGEKFISE